MESGIAACCVTWPCVACVCARVIVHCFVPCRGPLYLWVVEAPCAVYLLFMQLNSKWLAHKHCACPHLRGRVWLAADKIFGYNNSAEMENLGPVTSFTCGRLDVLLATPESIAQKQGKAKLKPQNARVAPNTQRVRTASCEYPCRECALTVPSVSSTSHSGATLTTLLPNLDAWAAATH